MVIKKKVKEKKEDNFLKEMKKLMEFNKKMLKPDMNFDPEYDIFYLWFGGSRKVSHTIEVSSQVRFDVTKDGLLVAVEIEGLFQHLKELSKLKNKEKKNARVKPAKTKTVKRRKRN